MKPEISLDPSKTALLVIDMQNDFAHEDGYYNLRGGRPSEPISRAIKPIARALSSARERELKRVFTRWLYPSTEDATVGHEIHPAGWASYGERLQPGTWGGAIVDELTPHEGELIIDKHGYSSFYRTELEQWLRGQGITCVVLTGTAAHACVLHTAFDAFTRGFDVVVVEEGIAGWFDDLNVASQRIVELVLGVTVSVDEFDALFQDY